MECSVKGHLLDFDEQHHSETVYVEKVTAYQAALMDRQAYLSLNAATGRKRLVLYWASGDR